VALSFLYRLIRRVIEVVHVHRMDAAAKDAEILVLRHQLAVCAARSPVPDSAGPTGPSSPSWPVLFLENTGDRSSSAHRRSWAGTARWSRSAGPTRTADQVVLVLPKRPWS
jgi:hypothetical protein